VSGGDRAERLLGILDEIELLVGALVARQRAAAKDLEHVAEALALMRVGLDVEARNPDAREAGRTAFLDLRRDELN
jgi:hypothetical protein